MTVEHVIFWISVLLLGYTYLGYPILICAWACLRTRRLHLQHVEPSVSLVIVAHNEASRVEGRLENVLSLDYPRDRLEILFASDGSTDGTAQRARMYELAGVKVIGFETRRGKPAVLNGVIPKAQGELVVLADARQRFHPQALCALVAHFADPKVGVVSGELILTPNAQGEAVGEVVGWYWRYEKFIRRNESHVSSTLGATGAIYAIRRTLFEPIPDDTILDDVVIPARIIRKGYRVRFEPEARAYDRAAATAREEFTRKVRTIAGNFQLFARERWLLSPFQNRLWFQTLSHKGLRLVAPLLQGTAFATNLLLVAESSLYRVTLAAQVLFFVAALGGYALRNASRRNPILALPYTVCLFSWATMVGFFQFVTGRQRVTWEKRVS